MDSIISETTLLTRELRQRLKAERTRTGMTIAMLLDGDDVKLDGLSSSQVNRWIGGMIREAPRAHVDHVIARYAALPDDAGALLPKRGRRHPKPDEEWIEVTLEMATWLRAAFARTGLDQHSVVGGDAPSGLTPRVVQGWLYHEAATTRSDYWSFVSKMLRNDDNYC